MPRRCTVCGDERRARIERAVVEGASIRGISRRFGISDDALRRHVHTHLPDKLRTAAEAEELLDAGKLLRKIQALEWEARRLLRKTERSGDLRGAVMALRELAHGFELCGKALVAMPQPPGRVEFIVDLSKDFEDGIPDPEPAKPARLSAPAPDAPDGDVDGGEILI